MNILDSFELIPEKPFHDYYRADVFINRRDNRRMIRMYKVGGDRYNTTYARYIFQVDFWEKYNQMIPDDMEVDHIDENKLNDRIENLQLLTHTENVVKNNFSKGTMYNLFSCPICGNIFSKAQYKTVSFSINICSELCLRSFHMSRIGPDLRKYLINNQVLLTFRVYRSFPSGEEYLCDIVRKFDDCFHPNSFSNAREWLNESLLEQLTFVDYSKRVKEILTMRENGFSYRRIGRELNLDKSSIRQVISNVIIT